MKKNQAKFLAVLSAAAMMAVAAPAFTSLDGAHTALAGNTGWVQEDESWYFYDEDSYKEASTWKKRDTEWYYLDENGDVALSQRIDEYYVGADGRMVKNAWISLDGEEEYDTPDSPAMGNWSYFGKDGKILTSRWMTVEGKTYYFDSEGQMLTGLVEIEGGTYYLGDESDGSRKTGWIMKEEMTSDSDDGEVWCYFDENGKMVQNQLDRKIGEYHYTFIDGEMQTGWVDLVATGFIKQETAATGSEAAPAPSLENFRFYDENLGGRRAIGWYTIEGVPGISESDNEFTFYFKNGVAFHSSKPGLELFTINSNRYCFNEKGEMQTGLETLTDENGASFNYYFNDNGEMMTGKQTIYNDDLEENQTWYFNAKGSQKGQGFHGERDNQIYLNGLLQKADPELRYESVELDGKKYLVNTSGTIQKASSTSTSSAKPESGKGFKDIKDTNDTVWTVDSTGIIQ